MTPKEALNNISVYSSTHNGVLDESIKVITKHLKALEIIKRELVIEYLYNFLEEKYDLVIYDKRGFVKIVSQISKEEGDILKKVL